MTPGEHQRTFSTTTARLPIKQPPRWAFRRYCRWLLTTNGRRPPGPAGPAHARHFTPGDRQMPRHQNRQQPPTNALPSGRQPSARNHQQGPTGSLPGLASAQPPRDHCRAFPPTALPVPPVAYAQRHRYLPTSPPGIKRIAAAWNFI
jgi:hypothetical protein